MSGVSITNIPLDINADKQISLNNYNHRQIDLLPILIAQQLVLFPLYFFIPIWITLFNLTIAILVYLSQVKKRFAIHSFIKTTVTLLATAGVLYFFQKLTGRDAGVALIATMYGLKVMEIKSHRDVYILMLIGFFILTAGFLFNQSPWIALYQFIPVAAILNGLISIHSLSSFETAKAVSSSRSSRIKSIFQSPLKSTIKQLIKYLLLAIPLMVVLFVFFPRLAGPIWKMPGGEGGSTGISDTMSPGAISNLQLFDKVAFRVKFKDKTPSGSQMYWRTLVLDHFDGFTWTRETKKNEPGIQTFTDLNQTQRPAEDYRALASFYQYDISLEKTNQRWLTFLDRPIDIPKRAVLYADYSVQTEHRLVDRTRYSAESLSQLVINPNLTDQEKQKNTYIPNEGNPRSLAWAKQQRQLYPTDRDFILGLLSKINQQEYFYTLLPPLMEEDTIDSFWFEHQKGFCEHYAGAFVFLARAAGIPARVVIGYQGAEKNPLSDYWIVRYANAHAWTEVWLENEGWVRVDPTSAIAPHRIEEQLQQDYSQREGLFGDFGFEAVDLDDISLMKQFEYWMDQANSGWNDWILDYNQNTQRRVFEGLGLEKLTGQQIGILMIVILAIFMTVISFKWVKNKQVLDPIQTSFQILQRKLLAFGIDLPINKGMNELIQDLQKADIRGSDIQRSDIQDSVVDLPMMEQTSQAQLIRILQYYTHLRYQRAEITQKQQNHFRDQVKRLKIRPRKMK